MPLVMDLSGQPSTYKRNSNAFLALTAANDTVTVMVDKNWPRILIFSPATDMAITSGLATDHKFPVAGGTAIHLEIHETTVFQVSAPTANGDLDILVVQ